ncbi:hypothetical protein CB0940_11264 [Cercospora beticola]|uniref:Uncharacterized protein n=1 Tax=Cercospora beticola TaxID=122368 RepID=A0A2G5HEU9_CERBT|nr:hypothetical protein CB0940_11264 [Cercospora beticola]PIA90742.1 hypothetical protein CB0940_11264 [Cercospora beticola]WPB08097.1 hypothetical protein RHO25_012761 [Cercospora beticola]
MLEMTLPSSPPLLPQTSFNEPPSSPPLPPTRSSSSRLPVLGKRQLYECDSNISSDPLFSDDTSGNEDATSYQRPKRKRMIKGKWWELAERRKPDNDATPKQKHYTRNVDSGVWMGSDGSEEHVEHDLSSLGTSSVMGVQNRPRAIQLVPATTQRQTPRTLAEDIVTRCVEDGKDRVDLSQLGLTELAPSTLKPLHELIRQPTFDVSMPPSDDELGPLTPDLQLFLAANDLTSLPDELFNLQNLTVLSVRNNALTELPSAISRLKRLQELNIGNNALHWLPWELLDVLQSRHVRAILHPNPFMELSPDDLDEEATFQSMQRSSVHAQLQQSANLPPAAPTIREPSTSEGGVSDLQTQLSLRLQLGHALRKQSAEPNEPNGLKSNAYEELIFLASSTIHYTDIDGHLPVAQSPPLDLTTRVPSLLEVSLRSVRQNYSLAQIPETLPDRVRSILKVASEAPEDQICSTCANGYILPRAEWVEYWYRGLDAKVELTPDSVLPFRRRACSWKCATPTEIGSFRA